MLHFHIITLFPEFFDSPLSCGVIGNAKDEQHICIHTYHLVDFKEDPKKRVDDVPYGGGAGMVLRAEPVARAIEHVWEQHGKMPVVHFTPRGEQLTQERLEHLHEDTEQSFILLCGRYEGIDERVLRTHVDLHFQVGDVIVSGGELPALYFIDSLSRLEEHVLGNDASHQEESFSKALDRKKEYPHYTRPEVWREQQVPEVLLSGHHKNIETYRKGLIE